jgi:glycyl-tRNA synthetase alpha chain
MLWTEFDLHEREAQRLLDILKGMKSGFERFPVLPAYEQVLKCSNLFNTLDARGAISVTERAAIIARVRKLSVGVAKAWVRQQHPEKEVA